MRGSKYRVLTEKMLVFWSLIAWEVFAHTRWPIMRGSNFNWENFDVLDGWSFMGGSNYRTWLAKFWMFWTTDRFDYCMAAFRDISLLPKSNLDNWAGLFEAGIKSKFSLILFAYNLMTGYSKRIDNNYSPKWRWPVVAFTEAVKRRVKYHHWLLTLRWIIVLVCTKTVR